MPQLTLKSPYFQKGLKGGVYGLSLLALLAILFHLNTQLPHWAEQIAVFLCGAAIAIYFVYFLYHGVFYRLQGWSPLAVIWDIATLASCVIVLDNIYLAASLVILRNVFHFIRRGVDFTVTKALFLYLQKNPARLTFFSFLSLIIVGAILLMLPVATPGRTGLSFFNALFMAASAVCVTGLSVVDVGAELSLFGQFILLLLIQVGGLGVMTLSASFLVTMGKQFSIKDRVAIQAMLEEGDYGEFRQILKGILAWTFGTELIGAAILAVRFYFDLHNGIDALRYGIFHSVSAFCNAGFSIFSDSLIQYQTDPVVIPTMSLLLILGGFGYVVARGLLPGRYFFKTIHVKLTLTVSVILILVGWVFILLSEYSHSMMDMPLGTKLWVSWFQAVTPRTAGFNSIDLSLFAPNTLLFICVLMFIGGCPGSTAGGIKTTTIGILFLTVRAYFLGREDAECFGRHIPDATVKKAFSIGLISSCVVTFFMLCLFLTESAPLEKIFFEVISAFGTVGLSTGLTPKLTEIGKLLITALMLVGRVGPLTVAFLIQGRVKEARYQLPAGKIIVG